MSLALYIVMVTPSSEGEQSAGTSPVPINQLSVFIAFPVLSALLQRHVMSAPSLVPHGNTVCCCIIRRCLLQHSFVRWAHRAGSSLRLPGVGKAPWGGGAGAGLGGWISMSRGWGEEGERSRQENFLSKGGVVGVH